MPAMHDYTASARLREELDEAQERIRQLEQILNDRIEVGIKLGLTPQQAKLFSILLKCELATKHALYHGLYGMSQDYGDIQPKIIDVHISKIRKTLRSFDLQIETIYSRGWRLGARTKERALMLAANFEQSSSAV
jgi:DNA-binding response OmpR family regulator